MVPGKLEKRGVRRTARSASRDSQSDIIDLIKVVPGPANRTVNRHNRPARTQNTPGQTNPQTTGGNRPRGVPCIAKKESRKCGAIFGENAHSADVGANKTAKRYASCDWWVIGSAASAH